MSENPFSGDVKRLKNERTAFRQRIGDWRIFFDVYPTERLVEIPYIERRGTKTYRQR